MRTILGLDLGTNTIDWATIVDDDDTSIVKDVQFFLLCQIMLPDSRRDLIFVVVI